MTAPVVLVVISYDLVLLCGVRLQLNLNFNAISDLSPLRVSGRDQRASLCALYLGCCAHTPPRFTTTQPCFTPSMG